MTVFFYNIVLIKNKSFLIFCVPNSKAMLSQIDSVCQYICFSGRLCYNYFLLCEQQALGTYRKAWMTCMQTTHNCAWFLRQKYLVLLVLWATFSQLDGIYTTRFKTSFAIFVQQILNRLSHVKAFHICVI